MIRHPRLEHRFSRELPEVLENGVLYVSMEYGSAAHKCCCGCGEEVVTPLTPTDWKLIYDGETVSLWPSIGNWSSKCRSHYMIERGQVIESDCWDEERIAAERSRDRRAKQSYYESSTSLASHPPNGSESAEGLWRKLRELWPRRS